MKNFEIISKVEIENSTAVVYEKEGVLHALFIDTEIIFGQKKYFYTINYWGFSSDTKLDPERVINSFENHTKEFKWERDR